MLHPQSAAGNPEPGIYILAHLSTTCRGTQLDLELLWASCLGFLTCSLLEVGIKHASCRVTLPQHHDTFFPGRLSALSEA
jgi:hypothetical protein